MILSKICEVSFDKINDLKNGKSLTFSDSVKRIMQTLKDDLVLKYLDEYFRRISLWEAFVEAVQKFLVLY